MLVGGCPKCSNGLLSFPHDQMISGSHWPTNSGVPKMFLNSLPKSILWARPKSMSLMRGCGAERFSSMMFSGYEGEKERKNEWKRGRGRKRQGRMRQQKKRQNEKGIGEREMERHMLVIEQGQEISHHAWKSHANLRKCSLESNTPARSHCKGSQNTTCMEMMLSFSLILSSSTYFGPLDCFQTFERIWHIILCKV